MACAQIGATGRAAIQHYTAGHINSDGANSYSYFDRGRLNIVTTPNNGKPE